MKIIHRSIFLVLSLTVLYGQPTVVSVSSSNANGTYSRGNGPIDITVTLSETVVVVSGTPQLTLETGLGTPYPADAVAVYTGGTGTNVLTFRYTIQTGDYSADLQYKSTSALSLNGASINDNSGDPVTSFTLPDLTSANSLAGTGIGSGKDFVIKTITATADIILNTDIDRNSNTFGRVGHMNADNKITFTVKLFGDDALPLNSGTPPEGYLNGQVTPYIAWAEFNNDHNETPLPGDYVFNPQFSVTIINATTKNITYTAANVESSNQSAIEHADNFDIRLLFLDDDDDNPLYLNIDNWGNAGVTDYLLYDGDDPYTDLYIHDYYTWEGENSNGKSFNFQTYSTRINNSLEDYVDEDFPYPEVLLDDGADLRSRLEFKNRSDNSIHTYYLGTNDPDELTTFNSDIEINPHDDGNFTPLVQGVAYDIGYIIYDASGNENDRSTDWITDATYDIVRPDVVVGYGPLYNSIVSVGGLYTSDTTKTDILRIWAQFGSESVNENIRNNPKIDIDRGGIIDRTAWMIRDGFNRSRWYYYYQIDSLTGTNPAVDHYVDGIATVTIYNATDDAGNTNNSATNTTFTIDTTPPTVDANSITANNSEITVTFTDVFSHDIYNASTGLGYVETDDFVLSIANGTATFVGGLTRASPANLTRNSAFNYTLTVPALEGLADGQEVVTIFPKVEAGPPAVYHIFDRAGNGADSVQSNNTVQLNDFTGPQLIHSPVVDTVYTIINPNNEWPVGSGLKYFNTLKPTLTLKASDATSSSIFLWCKIDGVDFDISKDDGATKSDKLTLTNLTATDIKIMNRSGNDAVLLTASQQTYTDHDSIKFYVQDISLNPEFETVAAIHPPIRLDTVAAIFDETNENHGLIEPDNAYVVVAFKEPVFGNAVLGSAVSNLSLIFDTNLGTATNAAIVGIAKNTDGSALAVGDSVMRVLLTITGIPDGLERIKILPGNGASVYDRAGNATAANVATDWIYLKDKTKPVGVIVTDISGNEPASGGKYVGDSLPQLTIKASDAYRNADNEITVSVTSADSLIYIKEAGQLTFTSDIRISGNNSDVVVTLASAADGSGLPAGTYDELDFVFIDYGLYVDAVAVQLDGYCTSGSPCSEGEADVENDSQCAGSLIAAHRTNGVPAQFPGLRFPADFPPHWDPCYDPNATGGPYFGFNPSAAVEAADFIIDLTPPEISSTTIANDNSYIDVTFNGDLLFNSGSGSGALAPDDFNLTFAPNGGTATAVTISNLKQDDNITEGLASALSGGETVIRIFLNITGTPGGVETITVVPTDASSIYDAAGHNASTTQANNVVNLVDKIAPDLTDPITISGNNVDGVNYVRDNTPGISIQANDALSNAANEITVSATATISGNPGTVVFLSEDNGITFATSVDIIGNNTPVALIIARLSDGTVLPDGSYSTVVITVTDEAGNSRSVTVDPFTIDATPPEFSSVVIIDPDSPTNSRVTVAFDSDVYKTNNGSGELGAGDQVYFQTTVNGGIAVLPSFAQNILEHNPSTRDTVVLSINPSDADGTEQLSITYHDGVPAPGDNSGVFDVAGNPLADPADTLDLVNKVNLWDETSPVLTDNSNNANRVFTDILVNQYNGANYFGDATPSLSLKATDASSAYLTIKCNVGGDSVGINPSTIIKNIETEITILDTLDQGLYTYDPAVNPIEFIAVDARGNESEPARSFQNIAPAEAILEPNAITINESTVFTANTHIDIIFSAGVFGNASASIPVDAGDLEILFSRNAGTATAVSIASVVNPAGNIPLVGDESIIRVLLNVTGTPNGLETIEITPVSSTSIFSRSTTPIPDTETTGTKFLRDLTPPIVTIMTDISGNEVGGMKYVKNNTPALTIVATDAKSTGTDDLILICKVNGDTVDIADNNIFQLTANGPETITITDELSDGLYSGSENIISFYVRDTSGNIGTTNPVEFILDTEAPADPSISNITTSTDPVVANYWNGYNTAINVTVNLPSDGSLRGGTVQLKAAISTGSDADFEDLGSPVNIPLNNAWVLGDPMNPVTVTVDSVVNGDITGFEELADFDENKTFKISAVITDRATNPNAENNFGNYIQGQIPIKVDQDPPVVGTVGAQTSIVHNSIYSTSTNYYWNIDTEGIRVTIDLPFDQSLLNGSVQLMAEIGNSGSVELGSLAVIEADEYGNNPLEVKNITVADSINDVGVNGMEELVGNFMSHDGQLIVIEAIVTDVAGNYTSWTRNTIEGPHDGAVKIDLSPATIDLITSTNADGWYMQGEEVNIQLQASEPIIVSNAVQCSLSTTGLAQYVGDGSTARIHNFTYTVGLNESSLADTNGNGEVDGLLEVAGFIPTTPKPDPFLLDTTLWVEGIQDSAGNYTPYSLNGVVHIPQPNTLLQSLDEVKELHIDGTAPASSPAASMISYKAIGGTSASARPRGLDSSLWKFDNGIYWNSTHTAVDVIVGLDDADNSLANPPNSGFILLKASSDPGADLGGYVNIGNTVAIQAASVAAGSQTIRIERGALEGIAGFMDGAELRITAFIEDIAGNNSTYTITTEMKVIKVDTTLPDTAGIGSGIMIDPTADPPEKKVPGYWNSHTTNIRIAVPLPDFAADTSMLEGRIDLLGKLNTNTLWDTLGSLGAEKFYLQEPEFIADSLLLYLNANLATVNVGVEDDTIGVEEITGFSDNRVMEIKAVLYDRAGNPINYDLGSHAMLAIDQTAPVITVTSPTDNSAGNTAAVAYSFSENIASGIVTWTRIGGAEDPGAPHVQNLVGDELLIEGISDTLSNNPALVNGTLYDITFDATEVPGNTVTPVTINSFTFDTQPPIFSFLKPDTLDFINDSRVSYQINENLESGQVKWTQISGVPEDSSVHYVIELEPTELIGDNHYIDIVLINDTLDFFINGEYYNVYWSGTDLASNPTQIEYVSTVVKFDTTLPTVDLIYGSTAGSEWQSQYIVGGGYGLTIKATFSEPMSDVPNPLLISIDYQGLDDVVLDTLLEDVAINDGTVWYYDTEVPFGAENSGIATVTITAEDRATNQINISNTAHRDTLLVDNFFPSCQLQYINITQDWLINEGRGQNEIKIRGDFNKPMKRNPEPQIVIVYGDSVTIIFDEGPDSTMNGADSTFYWTVTLPEDSNNSGIMRVDLVAYDWATTEISQDSTFNDQLFTVDNTPPYTTLTDTVIPFGYNAQPGWINAYTDSIGIQAQIPNDPSLPLNRRGGVDIQIKNITRPPSQWVTISNIGSLYGDSLEVYGDQMFYRSMAEITNVSDTTDGFVPDQDMRHGDTLIFRLVLSDRVGNSTNFIASRTMLVFDPIQPKIINLNSGNMVTETALVSTDNINAGWSGSVDSAYAEFGGSGIAEYRYMIMEYDTIPPLDTLTIVDWTSVGINVSMDTTLDLTPRNLYQLFITAVDSAGNEIDTTITNEDGSFDVIPTPVASHVLPRLNSPPIIGSFNLNTAWEDSLYTAEVTITDVDIATAKGDSFTYHIDWDTATTIVNGNMNYPIPDEDYPLGATIAIDSINGLIAWTPVPLDTGRFDVEIIVKDAWDFADTLVYPLTIHPVNDRPYFRSGEAWDLKYDLPDLPLPDIAFFEDQDASYVINMTKYILDEDNDDYADISWQAIIEDTISQPGYPRVTLVFGPGTTDRVKEHLQAQYLPQYKSNPIRDGIIQHTLPDPLNRSTANLINITFMDSLDFLGDSTYAVIRSDSNYWAENIQITFIATDIHETFAVDSLLLDVVNINDRPQWTQIPDQQIFENDTLQFDIGTFVTDLDDTLLTFNTEIAESWTLINGSWTIDTTGANFTIIPPEYTSTDLGDTLIILPNQVWSGYAVIKIIVTDEQGASDTVMFRLDVAYVPRPHLTINVIQNNAFTHYFDVIITDTLQKARNVILAIENNRVHLDTLDEFTYLGHTLFQDPGIYRIEVFADALVGDTTVRRSVGLALARTLGRWNGSSPDGLFNVTGETGAVNMDQSILVVDSTMFKKGYTGSYKMGDEGRWFSNPVEVSLASYDDEQALYQRNSDNSWTELPSYTNQGRIRAYTDKMGYFRLGRKTVIVPGLTSLGQNYPNPFNPVTNITYDVGFVDGPQQQVNLSIYNLLGQQVVTLVNEQRSIGRHSIKWYGRDKVGVSVASGIYFVHMITSAGKVQTKKVMLLR